MKKLLVLFFALLFVTSAMPVYAQFTTRNTGAKKETVYNRMTDWFATAGKSQEEKYRIMHQRRTVRRIEKAKKRIAKQKRAFAKKKKAFNR